VREVEINNNLLPTLAAAAAFFEQQHTFFDLFSVSSRTLVYADAVAKNVCVVFIE
jgi:hypothetical protein